MDLAGGSAQLSALIGLGGGMLLGLAARVGRFCALGAIEDLIYQRSDHRMRMWGVAIAVAMLGAFASIWLGLLPADETAYLQRRWNPIASIVGGLTFGYGMAIAGCCGFGALARLGSGDLRAFVIAMVIGLSAYITMSGPLAKLRLLLFPYEMSDRPQGLAHLLSDSSGLPVAAIGLAAGTALLCAALASRDFLARPQSILWGAAVGLAVMSGWLFTALIAEANFGETRVMSYTFAAPIGETLLYAMIISSNWPGFAVGSVAGVLAGSMLGALSERQFRWEACDDPRELRRQMLGAAMMGVGAVVATGCNVGQGITAFALLAYSAPVTLLAIFAGATVGLRQLIEGFERI